MSTTEIDLPVSDADLFSDDHLREPYANYRALRDLGPAVKLSRYGVTGLFRYRPVRSAVDDWETFRSGEGVSLNELLNKYWTGTVIASDPPYHSALRSVLNDRLQPRQVRKLTGDIDARLRAILDDVLANGDSFDAIQDVAYRAIPEYFIELVGFPKYGSGSEHLLEWAEQIFNVNGPDDNARMQESAEGLKLMFEWLGTKAGKDDVTPGGFARAIHDAADKGVIKHESVVPLLAGYSIPGIDTSIGLIGNAVALFAENPEQWEAVCANPDELLRPALVEVLRMDAPVQWFARALSKDWTTEDVTIPAGERVMLMFGSANRDERHYPDPDTFDVTRDPMDHVSFGGGVHGCPGQHLAQLQVQRLLRAFIDSGVKRFELNGEPKRTLNNTTRAFFNLPVRIIR